MSDPGAYAIIWDAAARRPGSSRLASYALHSAGCGDVARAVHRIGGEPCSVTFFRSAQDARQLMTDDDLGDLDDAPCVPPADKRPAR